MRAHRGLGRKEDGGIDVMYVLDEVVEQLVIRESSILDFFEKRMSKYFLPNIFTTVPES